MEIIFNNNKISKDTFIYELKYNKKFDNFLFIELLNDFIKNILGDDKSIEKEALITVFNFYRYLNICIIAHFDTEDLYKIVNFSNKTPLYAERLGELIKLCIGNNKADILTYKDELGGLYLDLPRCS